MELEEGVPELGFSVLFTYFWLCWVLITVQAFCSCSQQGSLVVECGLLIAVAGLVVEHGLRSCGKQTLLLHGMWDLSGPGIEPMSPAWAGGGSTVPPGKSLDWALKEKLVF